MYIIINSTSKTEVNHSGSYPINYIEDLLNKGDKLIVISLYSNTIKVPKLVNHGHYEEWSMDEYDLPSSWTKQD